MKLSEPSLNAYQEHNESEIISKSGTSLRVIQNVLCWNIIASVLYAHDSVFRMTESKLFLQWEPFSPTTLGPVSQEMTFIFFFI